MHARNASTHACEPAEQALRETWHEAEGKKWESLVADLQAQSARHAKMYNLFTQNVDAMKAALAQAKTGFVFFFLQLHTHLLLSSLYPLSL